MPTQNSEIPKNHRVHTNFFEKFARTFAFFPVTRVSNPTEIVQKNLFGWTFLFWVDFFGWIFLLWRLLLSAVTWVVAKLQGDKAASQSSMDGRLIFLPLLVLARRRRSTGKTSTGNNFPKKYQRVPRNYYKYLSGTGDSQRDSRESIRANHSQSKPLFYRASGRFTQMTRIFDSRESPDSRESCESIRANHATKTNTGAKLWLRFCLSILVLVIFKSPNGTLWPVDFWTHPRFLNSVRHTNLAFLAFLLGGPKCSTPLPPHLLSRERASLHPISLNFQASQPIVLYL